MTDSILDRLRDCHETLVVNEVDCDTAAAVLVRAALVLEDINPMARAALGEALRSDHDSYCGQPDCLDEQVRFIVDSLQEWAIK